MRLRLEVSKRARFDTTSIWYFIAKGNRNPRGAKAFLEEFKMQANMVCEFPEMRPLCPDPLLAARGLRSFPVTNSYVALYRVMDDMIYVWRVFHQASEYAKLARIDLENDWPD